MIDFLLIGAQKSATSWLYANLSEHPEICAPVKEIHFFSRDRYAEKGISWYENHFKRCSPRTQCGECSTSYLYSEEAPLRIFSEYPNTKIIALLRNPIDRALSQYRNALKAGEISEEVSFSEYTSMEPSVLEQGLYTKQLQRYKALFPEEQLLVLLTDDIEKDRKEFISRVYRFLGVDDTFTPQLLEKRINTARIPKHLWIEKCMHVCAEYMRRSGLHRVVHSIRVLGIPDLVRKGNTKSKMDKTDGEKDLSADEYEKYRVFYSEDVRELERYINRDLKLLWKI